MAELLTFLWVANTCYLVFKVVSNITYLVAIVVGHVIGVGRGGARGGQAPPII